MLAGRHSIRNKLLGALDNDSFDSLSPHFQLMSLKAGEQILSPGETVRNILFVESGLISTASQSADGRAVDVQQIGPEGMVGYQRVLGAASSPWATLVRIDADVIMVPADAVLKLSEANRDFRNLLLGYVYVSGLEVGQFALASLSHRLNTRLARWLLMCRDRLQTDDLPVTHEFLASVLGVRRAGVTNELHILEGSHAVKPTRGNVKILDPDILMAVAGNSYGMPEKEHRHLLSMFSQTDRTLDYPNS